MKSLIDTSTAFFRDDLLILSFEKSGLTEQEKNQKRVDVQCLKIALSRFLRSGTKENAFDVYFCFVEIFKLFGGYSKSPNTLLNLLYDHEVSTATLLEKHRDHYSHSVYNFAIGLALYDNNKYIRDAFLKKYLNFGIFKQDDVDYYFLKSWGVASLFHDVGYPFEITFDDLVLYQAQLFGDTKNSFVQVGYNNVDGLVSLTEESLCRLGGYSSDEIKTINDLLSVELSGIWTDKDGNPILVSAKRLKDHIEKGEIMEEHGADRANLYAPKVHTDHAYFSAVILLKKLLETEGFVLDRLMMRSIVAILLHAGFFRFNLRGSLLPSDKKLSLYEEPLSYLLCFCDELQCWDRTPYGKRTKGQVFPWDIDIEADKENDRVFFTYYLGESYISQEKMGTTKDGIIKDVTNNVVLTDAFPKEEDFKILVSTKYNDKRVRTNLSETRYVDSLVFAQVINASYCGIYKKTFDKEADREKAVRDAFSSLSLEMKLSNIQQAKHYSEHLQTIGCFFSGKHYDLEKVTSLSNEEKRILSQNEHIRWARNAVEFGWRYGVKKPCKEDERGPYDYCSADRADKRLHENVVPFSDLDNDALLKDIRPMENIIKNLSLLSNLTVYRIRSQKQKVKIGCVGHRNLSRIKGIWSNEESLRSLVRKKLRELSSRYDVSLLSGFGSGSELLLVEEAYNCNIPVYGYLTEDWRIIWERREDRDKFAQLLSEVSGYQVNPLGADTYKDIRRFIVDECDFLLALWDRQDPPEEYKGSVEKSNFLTSFDVFDAIEDAKKMQKQIIILP